MFGRATEWIGVQAVLAIGYILLAAAAAGFFARRRSALAGGLSVIAGALVAGLASYVGAGASAPVFDLVGYELRLVLFALPYALAGLVAGALGGRARAALSAGR